MTGPDPAKCTSLETQRFVEQTQAVAANMVIAEDAATASRRSGIARRTRQTANCIRDAIDAAGPEQIQAAYLSPEQLFGLIGYC